MLRNFTFVVQIAYFCIRPNKRRAKQKIFLLFLATFAQLSLQKATFGQLFEKFRATFWKSRATCGEPYPIHTL